MRILVNNDKIEKIRILLSTLLRGDLNSIIRITKTKLYSDVLCYWLRRDLSKPFKAPEPKIPVIVRELQDKDIPKIFDYEVSGATNEGILALKRRFRLIKANIGTCYVALTKDDYPCHLTWRLTAEENGRLQAFFGGELPILKQDEMILEHIITLEHYRGLGIMPYAISRIAERGISIGVRWVNIFVDFDNVPALKGFLHAGFQATMVRKEEWRLFRRKITFKPLPDGYQLLL